MPQQAMVTFAVSQAAETGAELLTLCCVVLWYSLRHLFVLFGGFLSPCHTMRWVCFRLRHTENPRATSNPNEEADEKDDV
jgi:hypothetical protein